MTDLCSKLEPAKLRRLDKPRRYLLNPPPRLGDGKVTAEIAVMNREAVALAADSAVTFRPPAGQKIFTSANKLFALSKHAPVGVMIYSNAAFMAVPWETVIKSFRATLGTTTFRRLEDYAEAFIAYLTSERALSPPKLQHQLSLWLARDVFMSVRKQVERDIKAILASDGPLSERATRALLRRLFREQVRHTAESYAATPYIHGFSGRVRAQLRGHITKDLVAVVGDAFLKAPLDTETRGLLPELALDYLTRWRGMSLPHGATGVVVAGFGTRDVFPAFVSLAVNGVVENRVRFAREGVTRISESVPGIVRPFAQSEMVKAFMEGVDGGYQRAIEEDIERVLHEYPRAILAAIPGLAATERTRLEKRFAKVSSMKFTEARSAFGRYRQSQFVDPVVQVVEVLPKDELAHMAETLVALTSFKLRVSMVSETVADPIDVAVISKGDGFIWIKRKHYFRPELNAQFFRTLGIGT
jgi:hypothetical protein